MKTQKKTKVPEIKLYEHPHGCFSFLPFDLPPCRVGNWEVAVRTIPAGTKMTVVSLRNAIFMGMKPASIILKNDTQVHDLFEWNDKGDHGTWMTSRPQEVEQHTRQLSGAHGSVIVGGLGLGMAVGILHNNPKVTDITVIEKSADVIKLIERHLPTGKTNIVKADLFKWLEQIRKVNGQFDFAFYDTWCPTGEHVWFTDVLPLRRLSKGVVPQNMIECWNEDEMIGQVRNSLQNWIEPNIRRIMFSSWKTNPFEESAQQFRSDFFEFHRPTWPFIAWMHENKPSDVLAGIMAGLYLNAMKNAKVYDNVFAKYDDYGSAANT